MADVWLYFVILIALGFIAGFVDAMVKDIRRSSFKKYKSEFDRRCINALKDYANLREANKSITTTYGSELLVKYTTA